MMAADQYVCYAPDQLRYLNENLTLTLRTLAFNVSQGFIGLFE
jgi:hypothetical protein